ncbi:VanZ family protein [Arthrobacter sp. R1-13]
MASLHLAGVIGRGRCGNGGSSPSEDNLTAGKYPARRVNHWGWVLVAYFAALAIIGYWPTPVDEPARDALEDFFEWLHQSGAPRWLSYQLLEAGANVLLFIPVGALCVAAFRRNRWFQNVAIGVMVSASMELGQFLFLDRRDPSPQDLVTNTTGTVTGIFLVYALTWWLKRRQAQRYQAAH